MLTRRLIAELPNPGEPLPKPNPGEDPPPIPHPNPPIKAETTVRKPLDMPKPCDHVVQLFEANEPALKTNVARYLFDGLSLGNGLVVVATPAHRESFLAELTRMGAEPETAAQSGRLVFLSAEATLARFMVDGHPNADRFDRVVGNIVREASARSNGCGLRVYGEMVGLLWKARQFPAAIRLEQLWNKLQSRIPFELFCAYPIDVFDKNFDVGIADALLCAHTHLLPIGQAASLESAINRAIDERHGLRARKLEYKSGTHLRPQWAEVPEPESSILWLRANFPDDAEEVLAQARLYYQASA